MADDKVVLDRMLREDQVRELGVTSAFLLGAMATFLLTQPDRNDRDHPLRMVFVVPLGQSGPSFGERFGVDVLRCST